MKANPIDPLRCPLCGQPNQCANEIERSTGIGQGPCWCSQVEFSAALLQKVPADAARKACICSDCATKLPAQQRADAPQ